MSFSTEATIAAAWGSGESAAGTCCPKNPSSTHVEKAVSVMNEPSVRNYVGSQAGRSGRGPGAVPISSIISTWTAKGKSGNCSGGQRSVVSGQWFQALVETKPTNRRPCVDFVFPGL